MKTIPIDSVKEEKKFGEVFKQQRKELNRSLKEVSSATSIRINYLQAVEEGVIGNQLPFVYARGFIIQYANYLGLNAEKLLQQYPHVLPLQMHHKKFQCSYGLGSVEYRGANLGKSSLRAKGNILWVIAFFSVLIIAWFFARYVGLI